MNVHAGRVGSELIVTVHSTPPEEWPSAAAAPAGAHLTIFQSREFVDAWLASFGKNPRWTPHFVKVTDGAGAPLMLLALAIERRGGMRILTFLDQGQADYVGPVLFGAQAWTEETMRALWRRILSALPSVDIVSIEKVPPTIDGLFNPLRLLAVQRDEASAHGNRLDRPWPEVEKHVENRKRLRGKERALERTARTAFVIAKDAGQRAELLERLVVYKQRRFEEMHLAGFTEKPEYLAFLRRATEAFAGSGNLLLCALTADDEPIAIQWCLVQGRVALTLVNGHAAGEWTRFSCGHILNYRLAQYLYDHGFVYLDKGFGDEAYKLRTTDTTVPLFRSDAAVTLKGHALLLGRRLRAVVRTSNLGEKLRRAKWSLRRRLRGSGLPSADEAP